MLLLVAGATVVMLRLVWYASVAVADDLCRQMTRGSDQALWRAAPPMLTRKILAWQALNVKKTHPDQKFNMHFLASEF